MFKRFETLTHRDERGRFAKTGTPSVVRGWRDVKTGRFVSAHEADPFESLVYFRPKAAKKSTSERGAARRDGYRNRKFNRGLAVAAG